jgi:hypothetical protein
MKNSGDDAQEFRCEAVPLELDRPDEPTVLSSSHSRIGMAIGCWFFATIAFIGLFILVGIAVLLGAIYVTLQIFNPKPTLVCSQSRLYPGMEFEVSWTHRGNTGRIQELLITLEGIEEATFKQGTSSRTERSLFYQHTILQTTEGSEINEGFRVLELPHDTMHSFKSSRNAVLWVLKVHGKIAWWPDMMEQFPIFIFPPTLDSKQPN